MPSVIELSPVAADRAVGLGIEAPLNYQNLAGSLPNPNEDFQSEPTKNTKQAS